MAKSKYLWYSDTHLNFTFPWTKYSFVEKILSEKPVGLILTGDIACGISLKSILTFLARKLDEIPIYFVLGNHDYYGTSFEYVKNTVKSLYIKYKNLIYLENNDIIELNSNAGMIGADGWYDARLGNPIYTIYNFDWIMIDDFRNLKNHQLQLELCRQLADNSASRIKSLLEKALEKYQTIYILNHVPAWPEATRGLGSITEEFWLPYNVNSAMGKVIEETMKDRGNQNVVVLAGHTHIPTLLNVSHNIECIVQGGKYLGVPQSHNHVFI